MENVSISWTENMKLQNKWHFVENEMEIMHIISSLHKCTESISGGVFLHAFAYVNTVL